MLSKFPVDVNLVKDLYFYADRHFYHSALAVAAVDVVLALVVVLVMAVTMNLGLMQIL